jgi:hypothetical protein
MFPHVGGKMKIHLNRDLLASTFTSISHILASDGRFLLTLCKGSFVNFYLGLISYHNFILKMCLGQGGTPFDKVQRSKARHQNQ